MKTPRKVISLKIHASCTGVTMREHDKLMANTTKANGKVIRMLIKEHLPELYHSLALDYFNPYESNCVKKPGLLVYVHSSIEYFLKYD